MVLLVLLVINMFDVVFGGVDFSKMGGLEFETRIEFVEGCCCCCCCIGESFFIMGL